MRFVAGFLNGTKATTVLAAGATAASVVGAGERLPTRQQMVRVLSAARLQKQWDDVRLRVLLRLSGERDADSRRS